MSDIRAGKKDGFIYRLQFNAVSGLFIGGSIQTHTLQIDNDSDFVLTKIQMVQTNENDVGVAPATLTSEQAIFVIGINDNQSGEQLMYDNGLAMSFMNGILSMLLTGQAGYPIRNIVPQVLDTPVRLEHNSTLNVNLAGLCTYSYPKVVIDFIGTKHYIR
jgi:hypothetical protein